VQSLQAAQKPLPTSIQFDVEPYSLPAWESDFNNTADQFIAMYEKLAVALKGTPLGLTACVPRWFDGRNVTRSATSRPLSQWLADTSDRLAIMDYVDNAQSIIADAANEIAYAGKKGREVVVGVETIAGLDPETVTFAEEGEAAMNDALNQVFTAYKDSTAFVGMAIHHYDSYKILKP
jgi:hypothetical protein